jgi:hypothetical protein
MSYSAGAALLSTPQRSGRFSSPESSWRVDGDTLRTGKSAFELRVNVLLSFAIAAAPRVVL